MNRQPKIWISSCFLAALACFSASGCGDESNDSSGGDGGAGGTRSAGGSSSGTSSTASGGATTGGGAVASGGAGGLTTGSGGDGGGADTTGGSSGTASGGADSNAGGSAGMAGSSSEAGLSVDEFCELLQERARSWLRECRAFGDSEGWWGTERIDRFCSSGRAAIDAGRLDYDPVQADTCAALSVGGCSDIEAFAYSVDAIPQAAWLQGNACEGVVTGTLELGDECHAQSTDYARECREGYCTPSCPGECAEFLEDGDPCDPAASGCDPETSFCNSAQECQAYIEPEGDCSDGQCAPGSFCYDVNETTYRCVLRVAAEGACDPTLEQCDSGLVCYENSCVAQVPLGAPCNTNTQCPTGSYCSGTCLEYVEVDGDCSSGEQCVAGSVCDGASCLPLGALDDPCPCDTGLYCGPEESCAAEALAGEPCGLLVESEPSVPCASGLSCVPTAVEDGVPTSFQCDTIDGLGDFCVAQAPGGCPWPLFCHPQSHTCEERAAEGGSCHLGLPRDSCQDGLYCSCIDGCDDVLYRASGECTPQLANDAECSNESHCQSRVCNGTCQAPTLCY